MNILGIDFEDWYHPELIRKNIKLTKKCEPTVIQGIDKILDWLRKNETYATFFVVGELLEFKPDIFDKIIGEGHEIGFHTMHHTKLDDLGSEEIFSDEVKKFAELTNNKSKGFRAPTFSLNQKTSWAIKILQDNDYLYDSSIVPAKTDLYGLPEAEKKPYRISTNSLERDDMKSKLIEYPILTTKFIGKKIPAGGGFYLRFLPLKIIKNAINNNQKEEIPSTFYIHSWELTPEFMPKISLPKKDHFITYHNLSKAMSKMTEIIQNFEFTSFEKYILK
tara:strand:+ start:218 stop:1048 length:831 start_codon:yes stop_codon:yes gene_type:complete